MGRRLFQVLGACGVLVLAGCGGLKLVPVSGKVTVGDQPITAGRVLFFPDESRGNSARVGCAGQISAQGNYELYTTNMLKGSQSGKGAPPGWYKVAVVNAKGKNDLDDKIHPDYFEESTTRLSVEVVSSPKSGQYDFQLTK